MKSKNLHLYIRYLSDSDLSKSQLKIVLLRTCNNCSRLPRKSRCEDKVIKTTCVALIHESRCEGLKFPTLSQLPFIRSIITSCLCQAAVGWCVKNVPSGIYKDKLLILLNLQCMRVINKFYFWCFCPHTPCSIKTLSWLKRKIRLSPVQANKQISLIASFNSMTSMAIVLQILFLRTFYCKLPRQYILPGSLSSLSYV